MPHPERFDHRLAKSCARLTGPFTVTQNVNTQTNRTRSPGIRSVPSGNHRWRSGRDAAYGAWPSASTGPPHGEESEGRSDVEQELSSFFFADGPGQTVDCIAPWSVGDDFISETQLTFSGQMFDFCRARGLPLYAVSGIPPAHSFATGRSSWRTAEAVAQPPRRLLPCEPGLVWAFPHRLGPPLRRGRRGRRVGDDAWFVLSLPTLARVKVIPCLHNSFWPSGYPQAAQGDENIRARRLVLAALRRGHALRFARVPEAGRDDHRRGNGPIFQFRSQYYPDDFVSCRPPRHTTSARFA